MSRHELRADLMDHMLAGDTRVLQDLQVAIAEEWPPWLRGEGAPRPTMVDVMAAAARPTRGTLEIAAKVAADLASLEAHSGPLPAELRPQVEAMLRRRWELRDVAIRVMPEELEREMRHA